MPVPPLAFIALTATLTGWPLLALPHPAVAEAPRTIEPVPEPLSLDGTPVDGSASQATPTALGRGVWMDRLAGGTTRYYAVRKTSTGSRLQVTALGASDASTSLALRLTSPAGRSCGSAGDSSGDAMLATVSVTAAPDVDSCDATGGYLVALERGGSGGSVPVSLVVTEEPPVITPAHLTQHSAPTLSPPRLGGAPTPVAGATSFGGAPRVSPGLVRSMIVPGETRLFRVRLAHGQSLRAGVSVVQTPGVARLSSGYAESIEVHVLAPTRGRLPHPEQAEVSQPIDGAPAFTLTAPVGAPTPEGWSTEGGADTGLAGDYYVAVSLQRTEGEVVPYTLALAVEGEQVTGPVHAEGAAWSVVDDLTAHPEVPPNAGPQDQEQASRAADASSDPAREPEAKATGGTEVSPLVWTVLGLAGALALTLLALVVQRVRRRRPRAAGPVAAPTDPASAGPPTLVTRPPVPSGPAGPAPWPGEES